MTKKRRWRNAESAKSLQCCQPRETAPLLGQRPRQLIDTHIPAVHKPEGEDGERMRCQTVSKPINAQELHVLLPNAPNAGDSGPNGTLAIPVWLSLHQYNLYVSLMVPLFMTPLLPTQNPKKVEP